MWVSGSTTPRMARGIHVAYCLDTLIQKNRPRNHDAGTRSTNHGDAVCYWPATDVSKRLHSSQIHDVCAFKDVFSVCHSGC